jgi:electron transport complex protein RnfC
MLTLLRGKSRATFKHGVHPAEAKDLTRDRGIEVLPTPQSIALPLLQHLGAPCQPLHKPKTVVHLGEKIADNLEAPFSAPIHASVDGTLGRPAVTTLPNGRHVPVIAITPLPEQSMEGAALYEDHFGGNWNFDSIADYTPVEIAEAARQAGLVGLGGAAFPSHIKLARKADRPVHTLLVNGCECEPFVTSDYRLMVESPGAVIAGALLAGRACGATRIVVCVEDNKPEAIERLGKNRATTAIEVLELETKYPQGGEKQLISAVLKREVPRGAIPLAIGVLVMNVNTCAALARAVLRGKPLTHRIVSVTGPGVVEPRNLLVPIGASYREILEACGGLKPEADRIVAGGPMMGFTVPGLDVPLTKGTGGITVLASGGRHGSAETACLRCGRCVDVCPMNLLPTRLALASRLRRFDLARSMAIDNCMECGCCAFACPAGIPLVQLIRMGKASLRKTESAGGPR